MGSFLDKPKTDKTTDYNKGNGLSYGVSAMQGWRIEMEDSHCSKIGLDYPGLEEWSFFAVFDGHAGGTVSKFSSKDLLKSILEADKDLFQDIANSKHLNQDCTTSNGTATQLSQNSSSTSSLSTMSPTDLTSTTGAAAAAAAHTAEFDSSSNGNLESASSSIPNDSTTSSSNDLTNQNNTTNNASSSPTKTKPSSATPTPTPTPTSANSLYPHIPDYQRRLKEAIRKGFLDFDEKLRLMPEFDRGEDKSGSTAVACLISPTDVYLINCGDSRAIFVSDNKIALSTYDHKPINPSERERIQNAGGSVMIQRVNGSLAVSRALGDYEYKCVEGKGPCEQLVSPEPEIYNCPRAFAKDEFVVLACDGIWDVMTNDDLREYIHWRLRVTNDLVKISNEVLDMCLNKGSRDNMSIIIVTFPGAPKVTQEEVEKDAICNQKIESKIKELIDKSTTRLEFSQVLHTISEEKWDDLPPGGGLYAKQSLIEEIFNRLSPKVSLDHDDDMCHHDQD